MPQQATPARAQTIKQAKSAFNKRHTPVLTDREKRQLDRSIELDRRAWRTREMEKRKAEAAKRKAEKVKEDQAERLQAQLGSQRRCDKFGYKSSQMHLGAFLRGPQRSNSMFQVAVEPAVDCTADDGIGDSGLDDETLLDAVKSVKAAEPKHASLQTETPRQNTAALESTIAPTTVPLRNHPRAPAQEDLAFFDEIDSSTQIARELMAEEPAKALHDTEIKTLSFSSGEFDLTFEELEELESAAIPSKAETDRKLMPPPRLPANIAKPQALARATSEIDFDMHDLELLAELDIQLTQVGCG